MAHCNQCGEDHFGIFDVKRGLCKECREGLESGRLQPVGRLDTSAHAAIMLTTETAHNLPVTSRLDIVTAEVVIGMHLFKDIAGAFRDTFGGRSKLMQEGLRDARKTALAELRAEAHALGADAVVGVDLDYSEISGGGKSMLFLVASGTAVTLAKAHS